MRCKRQAGRCQGLYQCFVGPLISMRFIFDCAGAVFGKVTLSSPFLNEASTLSSSMSRPSGIRRSNLP